MKHRNDDPACLEAPYPRPWSERWVCFCQRRPSLPMRVILTTLVGAAAYVLFRIV